MPDAMERGVTVNARSDSSGPNREFGIDSIGQPDDYGRDFGIAIVPAPATRNVPIKALAFIWVPAANAATGALRTADSAPSISPVAQLLEFQNLRRNSWLPCWHCSGSLAVSGRHRPRNNSMDSRALGQPGGRHTAAVQRR